MTTITIISTPSPEDAALGFEPSVALSFDDVDDATALAYVFSVASRAFGYTYIDSCILMDTNDTTWDSQEFMGAKFGEY
jgi:hypothetical protein